MGGNKGDYIQYCSYPTEVSKYVDLIKSMDARDKDNENALSTYVSKGGWNARKNGRDLTINKQKYKDEVRDRKLIITVESPSTDWREWLKHLDRFRLTFHLSKLQKDMLSHVMHRYQRNIQKKLRSLSRYFIRLHIVQDAVFVRQIARMAVLHLNMVLKLMGVSIVDNVMK